MTDLIDPKQLTHAELRALLLLIQVRSMRRIPGGYGGRGAGRGLTLRMAGRLKGLKLARIDNVTNLVPTGAGRTTADVWEERHQRKRTA
jgi:hypothetical protein